MDGLAALEVRDPDARALDAGASRRAADAAGDPARRLSRRPPLERAAKHRRALRRRDSGGRRRSDALVPRFTYVLDDLTQLAPRSSVSALCRPSARSLFGRCRTPPLAGSRAPSVSSATSSTTSTRATTAQRRWAPSSAIFPSSPETTIAASSTRCSPSSASPFGRTPCHSTTSSSSREGEAKGGRGAPEADAAARADVLSKLLTLKFGVLPEDVIARIGAASVDQLDRWVERVLTAESLDDVLA